MADGIYQVYTDTLENKADNLSKELYLTYEILGFKPGILIISKICENRDPNVRNIILRAEYLVLHKS